MPPAPGTSALRADVVQKPCALLVNVPWTDACAKGILQDQFGETSIRREPNRALGSVNLAAGGALAVTSGFAFYAAGYLPSAPRCHPGSDGQLTCSSPSSDATLIGLFSAVGAAILITAGALTLVMKPKPFVLEYRVDKLPSRVLQRAPGAPCGAGAPVGLGISAFRAEERIAASVTNIEGKALLAIPPTVTGPLELRVDSVPKHYPFVINGEHLAWAPVRPPDFSGPRCLSE